MNFAAVDWAILVVLLVVLTGAALYTRRYATIRTMMHHPDYRTQAAQVSQSLDEMAPAMLPEGKPGETEEERSRREEALRAELRTPLSLVLGTLTLP